ncbi:MAG: GAF domain-containing protein, partial [Deltaproteobacteria bacterium]
MANKLAYEELEQKVKKLEKETLENGRVKEVLQERTHSLRERVKELNCLYGISSLCDKRDISLEEILQAVVDLLPLSWQYADIACSRIILQGEEYVTENFKETNWKQASDIIVYGEPVGSVEVCYLEERAESDEEPFLKEERSLINSVAERLGRITERKRAEQALERRNRELSSLNAIATTIGQSLELKKRLENTLRTVCDLMGLKAGWIFLKEDQSDRLTLVSHLGLSAAFLREEMERPPGDCICFHVMRRKEALIAEKILECPRLSRSVVEKEHLSCHASVPLISRDKVLGVMNLASEEFRPFSAEDLRLLTAIGHQVGVAIENARLFEDTRQKSSELQEAYGRLKSLFEDLKAEKEKTRSLRKALEDKYGLGNIVGKNHKMQAIYELIEGISQSDSTVLIQGESGTGKELIARAIHLVSPRKDRPFVVANCSAYAETLLESE